MRFRQGGILRLVRYANCIGSIIRSTLGSTNFSIIPSSDLISINERAI